MNIDRLFNILILVASMVFCVKAVGDYADRPAVYVSYSTGECVEVRNFKDSDRFDCRDLPTIYEHVWVQ